MADIQLTKTNGKIAITSPYSAAYVRDIKQIGGKWNPTSKTWTVDERDEDRLNTVLAQHFGWNPEQGEGELVTFRITLTGRNAYTREYTIAGRRIAYRAYRDSAPILADGVVIVEGNFTSSGGSKAGPMLFDAKTPQGKAVTLEVRDFPKGALEAAGIAYELVTTGIDREALEAEKTRLLARLAEIDALLA